MNHVNTLPKQQATALPSVSFKSIGKKVWSIFKSSVFVTSLRSDLTWEQFEQLEAKKTIHSYRHF